MHDHGAIAEGRYRLTEKLGQGGMAVVYRAWDTRLRVWRALKILAPAASARADLRQRFETEAHTMARLRHPNVVAVHDVGHDDHHGPWLVMDIVLGGSVHDLVRATGPLGPKTAGRLVADMLAGLSVAHANGVVHRDVKPHNVLLETDGRPVMSDFGIARIVDEDTGSTRTGMALGTQAYMAPEQRSSARTVDARADIYAAGATLLALVTGKDPYDLAVAEALDEQLRDVAPPIAAIVRRATRWDPAARWPSAEAMREALLDAIEPMPPEQSLLARIPTVASAGPPPADEKRTISDWTGDDTAPRVPAPPVTTAGMTIDASLPLEPSEETLPEPSEDVALPPAASPIPWVIGGVVVVGLVALGVGAMMYPREPVAEPIPEVVTLGWVDRAVTAFPAGVDLYGADLSPDGTRVVWSVGDGVWTALADRGAPDLVRLPPEWTGGQVRFAGNDALLVVRPADHHVGRASLDGRVDDLGIVSAGHVVASPDGTTLAWDGGDGVHIRDGTGDRIVRSGPDAVLALAWSCDGQRLAVAVAAGPGRARIDVLGRHGEAGDQVAVDGYAGGLHGVAWAEDGRLLVTQRRGHGTALQAIEPASGATTELAAWPDVGVTPIRRVGDRLLLYRVNFPSDVWAGPLSATGARLTALTTDERHDGSDAITADGRVFFTSFSGEGADAWSQQVGNPVAERIATGPGFQGSPVPVDGGVVYFDATGASCTITVVKDGLVAPLIRTGARADCGDLRCDDAGDICAFTRDTAEIHLADLRARTSRPSGHSARSFDVSPAGDALAYTAGADVIIAPITETGEVEIATSTIPIGVSVTSVAWPGPDLWALTEDRAGSAIWQITAAGPHRVGPIDAGDHVEELVVAPGGGYAAISVLVRDDDVWISELLPVK